MTALAAQVAPTTTPLIRYMGRRIAMSLPLPDSLAGEALRYAVRDRHRALVHDRQVARLLAARRWDRRAEAAARRARALRAG